MHALRVSPVGLLGVIDLVPSAGLVAAPAPELGRDVEVIVVLAYLNQVHGAFLGQ